MIAYSLLEAGRLWNEPSYTQLGQHLLWRISAQTLRKLPGLGIMLLPADYGFDDARGWRLNPSYLPPQLLDRFALVDPCGASLRATPVGCCAMPLLKALRPTGCYGRPPARSSPTRNMGVPATMTPFVSICG